MTFTTSSDNVANIVGLLDSGWLTANVAKPKITDVVNPSLSRTRDLSFGDWIYVYEVDEINSPNDIGAHNYKSITRITIDINTMGSRSSTGDTGRQRINKLVGEVERIIHSQRNNPVDSSNTVLPFRQLRLDRKVDLSNKKYSIWRVVYDVVLTQPMKSV